MLYLPDEARFKATLQRLEQLGYPEVEPENPYWQEKGAVTIAEPDG